jgi:hypothetical protein
VLRSRLAEMSAPDFFDTERRLAVTNSALIELNTALAQFHVQAERIYVRTMFYRDEYEDQLQQIQLLQQQALLDQAQQDVAQRQQVLDTYNQDTTASLNSRNAWWDEHLAVLDRAYNVGYTITDLPYLVDAVAAGVELDDPTTAEDESASRRAQIQTELEAHFNAEAYRLGIQGINANTERDAAEIEGTANALEARYQAQADLLIAEITYDRDRQINELLSSSGGRTLVALEAARNIQFASSLVFESGSIPFIFDLQEIARHLTGESSVVAP